MKSLKNSLSNTVETPSFNFYILLNLIHRNFNIGKTKTKEIFLSEKFVTFQILTNIILFFLFQSFYLLF